MKLIDDFFTILEISEHESEYRVATELKSNHIIYTGHFPGYPVTPGVVQLQMVHEILETLLEQDLELTSMRQCKFLKVVNPEKVTKLNFHFRIERNGDALKVKAWGTNGAETYFKLNAHYCKKSSTP